MLAWKASFPKIGAGTSRYVYIVRLAMLPKHTGCVRFWIIT